MSTSTLLHCWSAPSLASVFNNILTYGLFYKVWHLTLINTYCILSLDRIRSVFFGLRRALVKSITARALAADLVPRVRPLSHPLSPRTKPAVGTSRVWRGPAGNHTSLALPELLTMCNLRQLKMSTLLDSLDRNNMRHPTVIFRPRIRNNKVFWRCHIKLSNISQ